MTDSACSCSPLQAPQWCFVIALYCLKAHSHLCCPGPEAESKHCVICGSSVEPAAHNLGCCFWGRKSWILERPLPPRPPLGLRCVVVGLAPSLPWCCWPSRTSTYPAETPCSASTSFMGAANQAWHVFYPLHSIAYWHQLEGVKSEPVAPDLLVCVLPDCSSESSSAADRTLLVKKHDEHALQTGAEHPEAQSHTEHPCSPARPWHSCCRWLLGRSPACSRALTTPLGWTTDHGSIAASD